MDKTLITDMTLTRWWSLNIAKEQKVCIWAMAYQGASNVWFSYHEAVSRWPWQGLKCEPLSELQCFKHTRKAITPPNLVWFNYFSLLHKEVTKCLVVIFTCTQCSSIQNLPAVLKSSEVLTSSCDYCTCIEIDICTK